MRNDLLLDMLDTEYGSDVVKYVPVRILVVVVVQRLIVESNQTRRCREEHQMNEVTERKGSSNQLRLQRTVNAKRTP